MIGVPPAAESLTVVDRVALPDGTKATSVHGGVLLGIALRAKGASSDTLSLFNWDGTPTSAFPAQPAARRGEPLAGRGAALVSRSARSDGPLAASAHL
jgi:hypothetical protein